MQGRIATEGSIDLAALDIKTGAEEGRKLDLVHPTTGEPLGMWILVLGADSEAYLEQMREFNRRSIERLKRNQRAKLTPEESEAQSLEVLVAITRGWSDNIKLDGQLLPFSAENARRLYADKRLGWIPEQIYRGVHDRANFLQSSAPAS